MAAGRREALSNTSGPESRGFPLAESQGARLSEQEAKLVARLLSDPTYFPVEFRTWLKNYIEGSGITLPASSIIGGGGGGAGAKTGLPAGLVFAYPVTTIPADSLLCDGAAVLRATYPKLYSVIGTAWGPGDGSTTFNVPDLRDRALYGAGSAVGIGVTDGDAYGARGGPEHYHAISETTDPDGDHSHSTDSPGDHTHSNPSGQFATSYGNTIVVRSDAGTSRYFVEHIDNDTDGAGDHSHNTDSSGDHTHGVNGVTSGGGDQDKPSYAGVAYVITTG